MTRRFAQRLPHALFLLPALLTLLVLAGCGPEPSHVLARVGRRTVTTDEFVEIARDKESQYPADADSAKNMLLDDLVRAALILSDAERLGLYREPAIVGLRAPIASEEVEQAFYRRLMPDDIPVSEAEIEQLYTWRGTAAHVRAILCASPAAAAAAAAELARGGRFAEVADRYSIAGAGAPGGDLGYVLPGSMVAPLDHYLLDAPLRTLIGPIESPGEGWFLLEVLDRRDRAQRPLDQQRPILRDMLRQRKVRALQISVQQALRDEYDARLEPGGAQAMFMYFNQALADTTKRDLLAPSPAQRTVVLARYGRGRAAAVYTLGDAALDLTDYSRERPAVSMLPAIETWIDGQVLRKVALLEAHRRGFDQDPDVVRRIDRRVDDKVLDFYYDVEISHGAEATPDDVRAAYERNRDSYQRLDSVDLLVATLPDSATAQELVGHAGHAPSLREAVAMAAPGTRVTAETVHFPGAPARWKPYQAAFMEAAPHACLGPVAVHGGWLVAQVVSKVQGPQAFEQLPPQVVQSLRQQAEEIARDRAFTERVEALRQRFQPEVHRERLRSIPWPVPGTDASRHA